MFTTTLDQLLTRKALKKAYAQVSKTTIGLDRVSAEAFEEDLDAQLQALVEQVRSGRYSPEPLSRVYIPKRNRTEMRAIGIGALKDKLLQRLLSDALSAHFDKTFSDKSYGYRHRKGVHRAIARIKTYLMRGSVYIYRLDLEDFFETIPHEKLLSLLSQQIADTKILALIALFLKNGSFERYRYLEHFEGIHQGDPLSPLLANIYLNQLDWFFENNGIDFVRFGDDMALFAHSRKQIDHIVKRTVVFLQRLGLKPNAQKSGFFHAVKEGFEFLGVHFKGTELSITKTKFDEIVAKQRYIVLSTHPFEAMIIKLNDHLRGIKRYYDEVLDERHAQFRLLQESLLLVLAQRITIERKRGTITTKKAFRQYLQTIELPYTLGKSAKRDYFERMISRGIADYLAQKQYREAKHRIKRKKRRYAKEYALASTLYVSEPGTFIGMAKQSITLKQKGKVIYKMPKNRCDRIIIAHTSVSLSGALVKTAAALGIAVDFIDPKAKAAPYASLYTAKNAYASMSLKQLAVLGTPMQLKLAKAFVKGKVKNQINYLIYLDKYHNRLEEDIAQMRKNLVSMLARAETPNELMGFEGSNAVIYWRALASVVEDKVHFPGRVTRGAKDPINAALNYGYAFLYSRVQYHLVRAGLSLHISFLHALDDAKPTLVYDLIEEFRAFVVDRTIFTMVNRKESLKLDADGLLERESRERIAKRVLERLGSYTKHRRASKKIDTIIAEQAYLLSRAIRGLSTYRPFIGKY